MPPPRVARGAQPERRLGAIVGVFRLRFERVGPTAEERERQRNAFVSPDRPEATVLTCEQVGPPQCPSARNSSSSFTAAKCVGPSSKRLVVGKTAGSRASRPIVWPFRSEW